VRTLIWTAGWAVADLGTELSDFEFAKATIALLTWNIAKAFKMKERGEIKVGQKPNFVVYDGVPGTYRAKVVLVADGDVIEQNTDQA
jgi:adenine deaminase